MAGEGSCQVLEDEGGVVSIRFGVVNATGFAYDGCVPRVVGVIQQPVVFGLHDGFDSFEISMRNGVTHCREGLYTAGKGSVGVSEHRKRRLGKLPAKGDGHLP